MAGMSAMTGELRAAAEQHLTRLAGPSARLRDDQWTAVEALVAQRRKVVVVQRTGWGKSAVYWIAAALRRAQGSGPALVISPLLALMRDQVAAAGRSGLRAVTLNSANIDDWSAIEARIAADDVDVLLISPERLNSAGFRARVLPGLAPRIGLLVVDEAHCVSDWGSDFRPDYRRIRDVLAGLPDATPVLATTATANERVSADVAAQLGADTVTLRGSLDRESLALSVVDTPDLPTAYAWIADALAADALPGTGLDLHPDRRGDDPARLVPGRPGSCGARLFQRHAVRGTRRDRGRPAGPPAARGGGDLQPGHGAGPPDARVRGQPGRPAVADRVLPAGGPRGARVGHRPRRAAAHRRRPEDLGVLRLDRVPRAGPGAPGARPAGRRPAERAPAGGRLGAAPHAAGVAAQGARRRRCRAAGRRRLDRHRSGLALRRGPVRGDRRRAAPGAAGDAAPTSAAPAA